MGVGGAYMKGQEIDDNGLASVAMAELHRYFKRYHFNSSIHQIKKSVSLLLTQIYRRKAKLSKIHLVKNERASITVKATMNSAV